uniref:Thrombospondin type 1 domain containing 1 n=1 Tax=Sphenodon punctatus TaxID=8508 RepID=A0A8D0L2K1_SPHPU
ALSHNMVSVDFQYSGNVTARTVSILLLNASSKQTIAKKLLPANQTQGTVMYECFHFKSAGNYWFRMFFEMNNDSDTEWSGEDTLLNVEWPVFHIDLNQASETPGNSLQVGFFTNEQLCTTNQTMVLLDVIFTSSFYELGRLNSDETLGMRTSKGLSLSRSQWVKFDCLPVGQLAYITVILRLLENNSVIASTGPIDIVRKFGYKLVVAPELMCESSVQVFIVSPPCTSFNGRIAVYKERPGEKATKLVENILQPENKRTEFNCTLFDAGKNKYCFDFNFSSQSHSPPQAKECVMIQRNVGSWSPWQAWTPCSVTCGDGVRERFRNCLPLLPVNPACLGTSTELSLCSLEECSTLFRPHLNTPVHPEEDQKTNNIVTITGISLCLFIIFATVLITLWRKLCRAQKCSTAVHHRSVHSHSFRKNSDEENFCQVSMQRESFSEGGEGPHVEAGEPVNIPLTCRKSLQFAPEGEASGSDNLQANAQKIIPPIFSYRLAQQQLKEMKEKGLTETTKVYHVSPAPLTDTVIDATAVLPLAVESQEGAPTNKFRIKSPFLDQLASQPMLPGDSINARMAFTLSQGIPALSPSQTLIRRAQSKHQDAKAEQLERGCPRNPQFRRTASFHEIKKTRPFRERSMSTLTHRQTPLSSSRTRTWDQAPEERHWPKARGARLGSERLDPSHSTVLLNELLTRSAKHHSKCGPPERKLDLLRNPQLAVQAAEADKPEQTRNSRGSSPNRRGAWGKEPISCIRDSYRRASTLSPNQHRKDKCRSFPTTDPNCAFYGNTAFGLTEAEQHMINLPGYFGSNEDDETSILSVGKRVI